MSRFTVEIATRLRAGADEVWAHASTVEGVNRELAPWVRMTVPRAAHGKQLADLEPGREAFASVLRLLGLVPFDLHHLTLERILERGFVEESWSWLQRRWRHERSIEPEADGCIVTDRITVEPRGAPAWIVEPIVRRIFRARHERLGQLFGT